jgi:hypothetical protein
MRARPELCLLEQLMEEILGCVGCLLGTEQYMLFQKKEVPKDFLKNLDEKEIKRFERVITDNNSKISTNVASFLDEILSQS